MSSQMCRQFIASALAFVVCSGLPLNALFFWPPIENVPIERVIQNLERRAAANPRDVQTRVNLARIHAMAYASKSETAPVAKARNPNEPPANEPEFGVLTAQFQNVQVKPTTDPAAMAKAREHLTRAIESYDAAIAIDPANLIARLGRAWCLDQAGDKPGAIAGYRDVLKDAWAKENAGGLPGLQNYMPLTVEVAGYLIPLLDPEKDAAEISEARLRAARVKQAMWTRPVTPIAIPLADDLKLSDLIDRSSRVTFEADGSGLQKRWTWITPQAGWLVFDKLERRQVTSALDWFGRVTFWLFWENGYQAMSALDDDGDGELRDRELAGLGIWRDANANGVSDSGEVQSLAAWHITRLSCAFEWCEDDPDMTAWSPAGVTFDNGAVRPTFDLLLYPR